MLRRWGGVTPLVPMATVAHVDLTEVTHLAPYGIDLLNELHARMTSAGWLVRFTPPAAAEARVAFHHAVIRRDARWA